MFSGARRTVLAKFSVFAWALALSGYAATAAAQDHGVPDWNGVWVYSFFLKPNPSIIFSSGRPNAAAAARATANLPAWKGKYLEQYLAVQKAAAEGRDIGDRGAQCLPQGMPGFWVTPDAFEIMQTPQQINLYQEFDEQTRRIYLNESKHPDDLTPSYYGHSIGHWEGSTLVIDTVGVRPDTLVWASQGHTGPHSDAMHIVERLESEGPDRLKVTMTVYDPKAFSKPWVDVMHLYRKPGMEVMEYVCEENNRNPVDASGETQAILNK